MSVEGHGRLIRLGKALREAESQVRILRSVAWPEGVAARFFERGARELPEVRYEPCDVGPVLSTIAELQSVLDPGSPDDRWLARQADAIACGARMLGAIGTAAFSERSRELYGVPRAPILDGATSSLALAERLDEVLAALDRADLGVAVERLGAKAVAARMRKTARVHFGDATPEFEVADDLAAKAVAGPRRVRLRRDAEFTSADVRQLVLHEVFVHVATSLNGREHVALPLLAAGHPGTTRTQEGLAVFSEIIGGAMAPARFRRLAGRVLAIDMALEGADFLDLYRFFLDRSDDPFGAFEDARRIVRGGLVRGGAPFTKDVVYLDGLLRVHHFLRTAIERGRAEIVPLLFLGKLDLEDLPDLARFASNGLCSAPRFLPPWAKDRQFLISYLAYAGFMDSVQSAAVERHYAAMLDRIGAVGPS